MSLIDVPSYADMPAPTADELRLAYEIGKYRDGQYGVLEYSLPPEQAREFERTIKLTEDILRHIVIRRDE